MAFIVAPSEEITIRITLEEPLDFGKTRRHQIETTFKRLSVSERKDWLDRIKDGNVKDEDVLHDIVINIKGCQTPEGKDIEFSTKLLEQLLDIDYARQGLVNEMMGMLYGKDFMERLKAKNS